MKANTYIIIALLLLLTGKAFTQPECAGPQGSVKWYAWIGVSGNSDFSALNNLHQFPKSPDSTRVITSLSSPSNFAENFGSMIKGYIQAPATGEYVFNITGDDRSTLFFSTSENPLDTTRIAFVRDFSGSTQYDKYPEQTSDTLQLVAGQFYYFEVQHKEGIYNDFVRVQWKTPSTIQTTTWTIVPGSSLYNYDCFETCPVKGTPCDDNNPSTTNDVQDGICNCLGTPANSNPCLGVRGSIEVFYWDSIPGKGIHDLHQNPKYPLSPNRKEVLTQFKAPITVSSTEFYGSRTRAVLLIPVTGEYTFNVTGDDETWLYFHPTISFEKATVIAQVPSNSGSAQFDKFIGQKSKTYNLQAGQLCYIEINHKENEYGDYFYVYWKSPIYGTDSWKLIDGIYLYRYACDVPCIPQGTPCNDGNAGTQNDAYDANCNCVGIPCPNGVCEELTQGQ